ncbi:outer membrane receptor protein involved in Fe transport [Constrictibacter sp. MBR-5]|uniref:hypothetical protein n=1 Tax=Constrictibacter sp. MBR-5 TaxID=3156467 RepID=UPI0033952568
MNAATPTMLSIVPKTIRAAALAAGTGLAVAAAAAPAVQARDAAATAGETLTGRSVMMNGDRIGEVVDTVKRDNTKNDVLIELDEQHYQMGVVLGSRGAGKMTGNESPVIVGGTVIAVPMEAFSQGLEGGNLRLSDSAVTTLNEFAPRQ